MHPDLIIPALVALTAVIGGVLEWRRGGAADRIAELESRVGTLERRTDDALAFAERLRRAA